MAVWLKQFGNVVHITVTVFWIQALIDGATSLKCWQCSWDRDKQGSEKVNHLELDDIKTKPTKKPEDDVIENPSVKPLYGKDIWRNAPDARQLVKHCENCTIDGGVCLQWTFRSSAGSENSIQNFTRMCARSSAVLGCYRQEMVNNWQKEVCLCKEDNCNGKSTIMGNGLLCILALLLIMVLSPG